MAKSKGRRLAEWLRNLDSNSRASSDTLAEDSVTAAKIADDAVTNPKIADGAIHTANIADTGVTFAKLHTALVVTESDAIGSNDNDTTIATSAAIKDYVDTQVAGKDNTDEITEGSTNLYYTDARADARVALVVDSAPTTLNTLNELAAALGDDANFSTTVTNSIAAKVPLVGGSMTGQLVIDDGNANPLELKRSSQVGIEFNDTSTGSRYLGVNSGNLYYGSNLNHATNNRVLTTADEGSGNGLDADTLDGIQGSSYLRSDADDTTSGILTTQQVRWGIGAGTYSGNSRSVVLGYSGGNYGQIGYGWIPTSTSGVHTSQINDLQSRIDLYNGIVVYGSGTSQSVGSTVSWTQLLDCRTNSFQYKSNTIWHAGNDGSGSGLDADTLDGQEGTYYLNYNNFTNTPTIPTNNNQLTNGAGYITSFDITTQTDSKYLRSNVNDHMNAQLSGGFGAVGTGGTTDWNHSTNARSGGGYTLLTGNATNGPGGGTYYHPFSFEYSNKDGTGNMTQLAIPYNGSSIWHRYRYSSSWTSWIQEWNSGNDGSGSGLDADLLDGQHGSYYFSDSNKPAVADITGLIEGTSFNGTYPIVFNIGGANRLFSENNITYTGATNTLNIDGNTAWHAGNDGSGSGLDADTLDGVQGSSYLRSDTSDTFTGNLTIASGSLTLPAGYNLQWGSGYNSGNSTIWADGTANIIRMAPTGNSSGKTLELKATETYTYTPLLIDADWGTGAYNEALTVYGTYPSYTLRSTTSNSTFLQHIDASGNLTWYFDTGGSTTSNWSKKAHLTPAGVFYIGSSASDTVWSSGNDGSGSGLDADTLDGIDSGSFLRSDAADSASGKITLTAARGDLIEVNTTATNPYFRFKTSGTNNGYIQFTTTHSYFWNDRVGHGIRLNSSGIPQYYNGTYQTMWHAGNDGSGSGLDADTVDGIQGSNLLTLSGTQTITGVKTFSVASGNIFKLNDTNASNATNANIYFYFQANGSNLGYIGYGSGSTNYLYINNPSAPIYLAGNSCLVRGGYEVWGTDNDGSGSGLDADTLDGVDSALYFKSYTNNNGGWAQSNRNFSVRTGGNAVGLHMEESDGTFGFQLYGNGSSYGFLNSEWGGWDIKKTPSGNMSLNNSDSNIVWYAGNDGSGSGLDADTVDGIQGASFLRSDGADTATGAITFNTFTLSTNGTYAPASVGHTASYPEGIFWHSGSSYSIYRTSGGWTGNNYQQLKLDWPTGIYLDGGSAYGLSGVRVVGNLLATGNITAYSSDERLKTNITTIDNALNKVLQLRGVTFNWRDDLEEKYKFKPTCNFEHGVIAQEVEKIIPDAITEAPFSVEHTKDTGEEHKFLTVDKEKIIPLLIEAIKEQQAQIEELKEKIK